MTAPKFKVGLVLKVYKMMTTIMFHLVDAVFQLYGKLEGFKEGRLASALGSFRFTENTHRVAELVYFPGVPTKYNMLVQL